MKKDKTEKAEKFDSIDLKKIPLGFRVRDKVAGFLGIAVAKVEYFNGCVQYSLKPKLDKDNKIVEAQTFDCQQLEIIDRGIAPKEKKVSASEPPGGDMPDAPHLT